MQVEQEEELTDPFGDLSKLSIMLRVRREIFRVLSVEVDEEEKE